MGPAKKPLQVKCSQSMNHIAHSATECVRASCQNALNSHVLKPELFFLLGNRLVADHRHKLLTKDWGVLYNSIIFLSQNSTMVSSSIREDTFGLTPKFHSALKHDRLILVDQNAIFCIQSYSLCEHAAFACCPFAHQSICPIAESVASGVLAADMA